MAQELSQEIKRAPQPVVFMFQPTRFNIVTGEGLREWEKQMREYVGLDATLGIDHATGTCCTSCCPDCDDCDQD